MNDLFDYPNTAGFKRQETSKAAAEKAPTGLRLEVLDALADHGPMTPDETAEILGKSILSIRPRFSELLAMEPSRIEDTGQRRKNDSGRDAIVWKVVTNAAA